MRYDMRYVGGIGGIGNLVLGIGIRHRYREWIPVGTERRYYIGAKIPE